MSANAKAVSTVAIVARIWLVTIAILAFPAAVIAVSEWIAASGPPPIALSARH
jgi:hypothetical protein